MRNKLLLFVATAIVLIIIAACSGETPKTLLNSGEIIQIVKHDDVEVKSKKCIDSKTVKYKSNGKTKTKQVCNKHKTVTTEVSPEWYEFELKSGNKTGWSGRLDESTGERYQEGDQYP